MCRCRQPQRQASSSQSTSTSPAPSTPSPTPPPLQPVTFSYMKSFRDSQAETQQLYTPHYFYYQDSYSSSSSTAHEAAATITAQALVHASCSLPSLHHVTNTITSMQSNSTASTLSRSLTMMPSVVPMMNAKTQTVLEHCSCGLTFSVEHIVASSPIVPENVLTEEEQMLENSELTDTAYYETIDETPITEHVHQHHSHHHGHIHYHMNTQEQTHNAESEEIVVPQQETTDADHHQRQHQHCCPRSYPQSFVQ